MIVNHIRELHLDWDPGIAEKADVISSTVVSADIPHTMRKGSFDETGVERRDRGRSLRESTRTHLGSARKSGHCEDMAYIYWKWLARVNHQLPLARYSLSMSHVTEHFVPHTVLKLLEVEGSWESRQKVTEPAVWCLLPIGGLLCMFCFCFNESMIPCIVRIWDCSTLRSSLWETDILNTVDSISETLASNLFTVEARLLIIEGGVSGAPCEVTGRCGGADHYAVSTSVAVVCCPRRSVTGDLLSPMGGSSWSKGLELLWGRSASLVIWHCLCQKN